MMNRYRRLLLGLYLLSSVSEVMTMQLAKPFSSRFSKPSPKARAAMRKEEEAIHPKTSSQVQQETEFKAILESFKQDQVVHAAKKTPLQIQQEAQLKHMKDIVKKDEVLIYQQGTALYDTVPIEKAMQCGTIKNMIEDGGNDEYPEIVIEVPYDHETIKNFCLVLRTEYKKSGPNKSFTDAFEKLQEHEQQRLQLISDFTSLEQLANILLLNQYLHCDSCDTIKLIQQSFRDFINSISFLFYKTIQEYRFALSYTYNTGQKVPINMWGPPQYGERCARRLKRNFRYYEGYFTSHSIKERFNAELKESDLSLDNYFKVLEKFSVDISGPYLNPVLKECKEIWESEDWITFSDKTVIKQDMEDTEYLYKNMQSIMKKWVAKFPSIMKPLLEKIVTTQEYNDIENRLEQQKPTLWDAFTMLNEVLNAWHSTLGKAENSFV